MIIAAALLLALNAGPASPTESARQADPVRQTPSRQTLDTLSGFGPDGFSACLPSGNAEAHLERVNDQIRMVYQLLEAELQQRGDTPRLTAMRALLADDSEMKMARYYVQTIAEESCKP